MRKIGNRVKMTTDTTGTGTFDLDTAPTGFRSFANEFSDGQRISYLVVDDPDNPTEYEYGFGVFNTGTPSTLSRETVVGSSNSGNKVSFSAGTKTVIATPLGIDLAWDVASKTTDYTVLVTDHQTLLLVDGSGNSPAGATIALPAIANVWPGFEIEVKNTGASGTVTLDGNGSETIDGATTFALSSQYDFVKIRAGSAGWHIIARPTTASSPTTPGLASVQVFSSGGTWNRPDGVTRVMIEVVAGGGGGGGCAATAGAGRTSAGGGGGGGGYAFKLLDVSAISSSTITVGGGGAGGTAGNNAGTTGSNSSWADGTNTITATGGTGGGGGAGGTSGTIAAGGAGGGGSGGDLAANGQGGGAGVTSDSSGVVGVSSAGGSSRYGGGGAARSSTGTGNTGGGPGGGGGGGLDNSNGGAQAGGAGGDGVVIVWEYKPD